MPAEVLSDFGWGPRERTFPGAGAGETGTLAREGRNPRRSRRGVVNPRLRPCPAHPGRRRRPRSRSQFRSRSQRTGTRTPPGIRTNQGSSGEDSTPLLTGGTRPRRFRLFAFSTPGTVRRPLPGQEQAAEGLLRCGSRSRCLVSCERFPQLPGRRARRHHVPRLPRPHHVGKAHPDPCGIAEVCLLEQDQQQAGEAVLRAAEETGEVPGVVQLAVFPGINCGLGHDGPPGIELITERGDDGHMPVLAVLSVIALWFLSSHGKGTAPGRLVAWGSAVVVVWVLLAIKAPGVADGIPGSFASGIGAAVTGFGAFIRAL